MTVTGKKLGTTSLLVWQAGGRVAMYSLQDTAEAPALERYLGALFPEDGIAVSASANTVTLTGRVRSRGVAQYALDIAKGTGAAVSTDAGAARAECCSGALRRGEPQRVRR
jgi:Flp pilus assembly secretin CpaC